MNVTNEPRTGRTTYHRDGSVTIWSVYRQQWERGIDVALADLAAMSVRERARVWRHTQEDPR